MKQILEDIKKYIDAKQADKTWVAGKDFVNYAGPHFNSDEYVAAAEAHKHIYGYAVGLDMTRRDLQHQMKKEGRPWCIGKGFDHSAPTGPILPVSQASDISNAAITLSVNGQQRQTSTISQLIWNLGEVIEHLSAAWTLQPGDLIFSGTPSGVSAVVSGDTMVGSVEGVGSITVNLV